jgi:hypothetical protein
MTTPRRSASAVCLSLIVISMSAARDTGLSAQGAVIFACASTSTGAIRVVSEGTACKPNESPLQLSGPGEPGEQSVLTVGTATFNTIKSVTVPGLGIVEASCDGAGAPAVSLQLNAESRVRRDVTTVSGQTSTSFIGSPNPTTITLATDQSFAGLLATYWVTFIGIDAVWKVDAHVKQFEPAGGVLIDTPCIAAASITTMD